MMFICLVHPSDYFERNANKYRDAHPIRLATWTRVFRIATELENDLFRSFPFPPFIFDWICGFDSGQDCPLVFCPRHTALTDVPMGALTDAQMNALKNARTGFSADEQTMGGHDIFNRHMNV
jgi:hypothetical protein